MASVPVRGVGLPKAGGLPEAVRMTLAFLLPVVFLIPFLEKAYHIDDTVYLWVARQIQQSPLDFYGFSMNWYGTSAPVYEFNQNPPGVSYFLAAVTGLFGWGEIPTHLAMALMGGFLGLGTYLTARQFTGMPLVAMMTAMITPAVLVSTNTVMSDIPMLTYYVWAILCWVTGLERRDQRLLAVSAVLCSLSIVHKYYGVTTIPLLAAYTLLKERKAGLWIAYLAIPVMVLIAYQALTYSLYGINLFSGAAEYALSSSMEKSKLPLTARTFIGLTFAGGCMASVFFLTPWLWGRRGVAVFLAVAAISGLGVHLAGTIGFYPIVIRDRYNWPVVLQAALMFTAGLQLLVLAARDGYTRRDAKSALLVMWFLGALVFSTFVNWGINARTMLPMAPAVGILAARRIEAVMSERRVGAARLGGSFALAAVVAAAVLWGDWQLANAQRVAAAKFARDAASLPVQYFYKGHWGFQYYMHEAGIPDWDVKGLKVNVGDRIVTQENGPTVSKFNPDVARAWYDLRYETPASRWVTTMHLYTGAGFYIHFWGPLPYAFGPVPPEFYAVYELGDYRDLPPP